MCKQNIFDDDTFFVVIKNFAEMTPGSMSKRSTAGIRESPKRAGRKESS